MASVQANLTGTDNINQALHPFAWTALESCLEVDARLRLPQNCTHYWRSWLPLPPHSNQAVLAYVFLAGSGLI
jgi:hypothetical protein